MLFPLQKSSFISIDAVASSFPVERITESMLALSDMAVILSQGSNHISYCSKSILNILGLYSESVTSAGWSYLSQHIHPQDFELLNKKLLPALQAYLKKYRGNDRDSLTFGYTLRMRHAQGHYLLMAIENQPLEWQGKRWPDAYMSVVKNITPYGDNRKMTLTIKLCKPGMRPQTIHTREFDFRWRPFTLREVEILRLVAAGLTSKQIGDRLHISPETIRNHRKRLLSKSGCGSTSELTSYAGSQGIL
jgi:DNA-binding CsgD family transcriptional regulator